jgi:predicted nuclease of predicted toxin-antitoxin system
MRFLVDECTGPSVATWLHDQGHDVFSVYDEARGIDDDQVIQMALDQKRILITNDKDFGEKVYRDNCPHVGIILMRLEDERSVSKIHVLSHLLEEYSHKIIGSFTVVSEQRVKFSKGS